MSKQKHFANDLSPRQQALVAIAVLLDGIDAGFFLSADLEQGAVLEAAANDLTADLPHDRLPHTANMLRDAIKQLEQDV